MSKKAPTPEKHWLNRKDMAASLGISGAAFDKWKVQPIARIGREAFFTVEDVLANRINHKTAQLQAKISELETEDDGEENGKINPLLEKARLDREKRIGQELTNDLAKGNLFPITAAEHVFSRVGVEMASILESLPAKMKRIMPKMSATQLNEVKKEIAKARNSCVGVADRLDEFIEEHYSETAK
jgi:phage terminase Nu1 subunit (DNA packaging protein)